MCVKAIHSFFFELFAIFTLRQNFHREQPDKRKYIRCIGNVLTFFFGLINMRIL